MKRTQSEQNHSEDAFTLKELLVVVGVLGLLALMILPAMAGGWEKATRVQCADNLRQLHAASMQFANENDGWLPRWRAGDPLENEMTGSHYSRYIWSGRPNQKVPQTPVQIGSFFQNAGYLYGASLIGAGRSLFCPTLLTGPFSAQYYSPLLTSDITGNIRSSYQYNPRVINAGNGTGPIDYHRRYPTTARLEPNKLFVVDVVQGSSYQSHQDERGFNVLLTDGAVNFSRNEEVNRLNAAGSYTSPLLIDQMFDLLEQER